LTSNQFFKDEIILVQITFRESTINFVNLPLYRSEDKNVSYLLEIVAFNENYGDYVAPLINYMGSDFLSNNSDIRIIQHFTKKSLDMHYEQNMKANNIFIMTN
jgi:hypothetical protein